MNMPGYKFIAERCTEWWRKLQGLDEESKPRNPPKAPDRRALAELRRLGIIEFGGVQEVDVAAALNICAFRDLIRGLGADKPGKYGGPAFDLAPYVIAATTLARIRADSGGGKRGATAHLLGQPRGESGNEDRLFAEARFKRLIRTRGDWPGLMAQGRRIAAILECEAPVGDLGASLILWNTDPYIARDWAFQYYQQREFEPAAPAPANS